MQCALCGQDCGVTHSCAGIAPVVPAHEVGPSPALRFDPLHYFSEAFRILCWDDAAVRRASRDNNSILYGFVILLVSPAFILIPLTLQNVGLGYATPWDLIAWRWLQTVGFTLAWMVAQIGLSHLLAKMFFEAKGAFVAILRACMLGQLFRWLIIVPFVGGLLTGLGGIALLMLVFEEVDGVERMKAFGLAMAVGILFWIGTLWLIIPPR
jgi:hypothetical protein